MSRNFRQLQWIYRNRQASRPDSLGKLANEVVESRCLARPAWQRSVYAMLEEHGGHELLSHVGGIDLRGGVLKLEVAEPAAVYQLGLLWEQRLLAACQAHLPAAGVHTVRFTARTRA